MNGKQRTTHLLNYEVLDLGLVYYKNIVNDPASLIEKIEELDRKYVEASPAPYKTSVKPWVPWTYGDGENKLTFNVQKFIPQVKNIHESDIYKEEQTFISSELFGALDKTLNHYSTELYPFAEKNIKSREHTMHLLRYDETGHLPAHQDQGISSRVLSVLLYLNDDYEGGEIEFRHSGIKFKPEAGSVLFFPSNFLYVHEVYPVTRGPRYALPNWYHNVPLQQKRDSTGDE
jgi:predicted 2-oxoglutarate/Fe(II)-dependent dioxygenase YbiX